MILALCFAATMIFSYEAGYRRGLDKALMLLKDAEGNCLKMIDEIDKQIEKELSQVEEDESWEHQC